MIINLITWLYTKQMDTNIELIEIFFFCVGQLHILASLYKKQL